MRALRWVWILRPLGRVPFFPAFRATAVGFAANTVLPARAGEVLRPALLARERGLPFAALLASIVFERVLDALAQLFFLGLALAGPDAAAMGAFSSGPGADAVAAAVAAAAVLMALFAVVWRSATERLFEVAFRILPERFRPAARRHRPHLPRRVRVAADAPPGGARRRRFARHVARHQRPDLLHDAGVRPRASPLRRVRRDDGGGPRPRGAHARRSRRLPRRGAVRADGRVPAFPWPPPRGSR